jgi:hypothetical protein
MAKVAILSAWADGGKGVLIASGVCSTGSREPWAMGRWRLDEHYLEFKAASTRGNVRIPLESIRRVEMARRKFLVVAKPVLVVTYLSRAASTLRHVWLLTGDLPPWEVGLTARMLGIPRQPPVDLMRTAFALTKALKILSCSTAQILDVLASPGGPVTSATLAGLLDLDENDAVVLSAMVADHFAPLDQVLGASALRYERNRFELSTGVVHSRSWWLDNTVAGIWLSLREPCDLQCDDNTVTVIMSVPTRSSEEPVTVLVEEGGRALLVTGAWGFSRYIELPVPVYDQVSVDVQSNGILVIVGQCNQSHQSVESPHRGS